MKKDAPQGSFPLTKYNHLMKVNTKIYTYLLDLSTIITTILFTTLIIKKFQSYLIILQESQQQISEISQILMQQTLNSYNVTQVDTILNQINYLTYKIYIFQYLLLPLALILPYLILQGINFKIINKTKLKNFIIISIPSLIIFILFMIYLMEIILSFYITKEFIIFKLLLILIPFIIIGYLTIIAHTLNTLNIKQIINYSIKNIKRLLLHYLLFSLTFFILVVLSLISISLLISSSFNLYIIPLFLIFSILFNYQRYNLINKMSSKK